MDAECEPSERDRPDMSIVLPDPTFLSVTEPVPVIEIDSPVTSPVTFKSELLTVVVAS